MILLQSDTMGSKEQLVLVENCPVLQLELVSAPLPLLASPDSQQNWAMSGWSLEAAGGPKNQSCNFTRNTTAYQTSHLFQVDY